MPTYSDWVQPSDEWVYQANNVGHRRGPYWYQSEEDFQLFVDNAGTWNDSGGTGDSYSVVRAITKTIDDEFQWNTQQSAVTASAAPVTFPLIGPSVVPTGAVVEYENPEGEYLEWRLTGRVSSAEGFGIFDYKGSRGCLVSGTPSSYPGKTAVASSLWLTAPAGSDDIKTISIAADSVYTLYGFTEPQWDGDAILDPDDNSENHSTYIQLFAEGLYRPPRWRYRWDHTGLWEARHRQTPAGVSGGWAARHRQNYGHEGGFPLRHR